MITPRLMDYVTHRTDDGAAAATVKNELGVLRRAFNLARTAGLVRDVPDFPRISLDNARKGLFELADHQALRAALPGPVAEVADFLFWSGWRLGETLGLRWANVDTTAGIIRIETSKSGEPRTLPYAVLPQLEELVTRRRKITDAAQKDRGIIVPWVFHRNGDQILYFRRTWLNACIEVGLGHEVKDDDGRVIDRVAHRIPHDYRRSAARNLSRAGVPERVIMQLCGWKTRSVFDRYRIVVERDLAEGLAKLATPATPARSKVARMKARR